MTASNLSVFNEADDELAHEMMLACCGSTTWCTQMAQSRPVDSPDDLHQFADAAFDRLGQQDWLEAFASHPKIGDIDSLKMKFAGNSRWSQSEQAGVQKVEHAILEQLAAANQAYLDRFGYIFIICATGKSASEMLESLNQRLDNAEEVEIEIAAAEQRKITHLRIDKLINN